MKSNSNKYNNKKRPQSSKDKTKMYLNQPKGFPHTRRKTVYPSSPKISTPPTRFHPNFQA